MKSMAIAGKAALLIAVAGLAQPALATAQYDIVNIGNLGDPMILAYDMNNLGQVVGSARTPAGTFHPFYFDGETLYDLNVELGLVDKTGSAFAINDNGVIVGQAPLPPENFVTYFVYDQQTVTNLSASTTTYLATNSSSIKDINNSGVIVGAHNSQALILTPNGTGYDMSYTGLPGLTSWGTAINEANQVAGFSRTDGPSDDQAFLFDGQQVINLDTIAGYTSATGLADPAEPGLQPTVVGHGYDGSKTIAWKADSSGLSDLGNLGYAYANAFDVNNTGQAVGYSGTTSGYSSRAAALFVDGQAINLNTLIPADSGWFLQEAHKISDSGIIMGKGEHNGIDAVFVMKPITQPPVAVAGGPYAGVAGEALVLDGTGSYDPEGVSVSYLWDFGDGSTGTGATPSHTYANAGTYNITLTVNDGGADSEPAYATVTVEPANEKPVAGVGGPYTGTAGEPITFSQSGSYDPEGSSLLFNWDFGDGSTGTGAVPSHTYASAGTYTLTLTVNDGELDSDPVSTTVTVDEPVVYPIANAGFDFSVKRRRTTFLDGSASHDPDGSIVAYSWSQVSGVPVQIDFAESVEARFDTPHDLGPLVFRLTVTDNDGLQHSDTVTVTVVHKWP